MIATVAKARTVVAVVLVIESKLFKNFRKISVVDCLPSFSINKVASDDIHALNFCVNWKLAQLITVCLFYTLVVLLEVE